MKALNHPLLELQLKDPDTLVVSPLRDFATEILVFSHCSSQKKKKRSHFWYRCLLKSFLCVFHVQTTLMVIREPLPSLVFLPLLRRKQVPGFLEEEVRYPKDSLACLAHLVFVHHLAVDLYPCVFR